MTILIPQIRKLFRMGREENEKANRDIIWVKSSGLQKEYQTDREGKDTDEFVNDCFCEKKQTILGIASISIGIIGLVIASLISS